MDDPPYVRLIERAELLRAQGRTTEAAALAWQARAMIYASLGVKDPLLPAAPPDAAPPEVGDWHDSR